MRERGWAAEVYQVRGLALSNIGLISLVTGGLCMVIVVSLQKAWPTPVFPHKLLFALFYTATFGSFTAGLTLLPLGNHLSRLNDRMPQPIFVHTDRLFDIVIKTVAKSIKDRGDSGEEKATNSDFEIIEVTRNPADGGIQGLVKEHKLIQHPNRTSGKQSEVEMTWTIDADKWGRLRSVKPGPRVLGSEPNMRGFIERDSGE
jgi:hypothetical protein